MTKDRTTSTRQQLLNLSRQTGESFQNLLVRYGNERLLYRISQSDYAKKFILKGASLFYVWTGELHRPTKDIDVLYCGMRDSTVILEILTHILTSTYEDDGLLFDIQSIVIEPIRETATYTGDRIKVIAKLGKTVIPLQVDIGIGDSVYPDAQQIKYPTILDLPAPYMRAYRFETAIAEKFEAMVMLDMSNSRMKDFYDIFILARDFEFDGVTLQEAIRRTFQRRKTTISNDTPTAWTESFSEDLAKQAQWKAFLQKSKLEAPSLPQTIDLIQSLLKPVYESIHQNTTFKGKWIKDKWL